MPDISFERIHATCVAIDGKAVLLSGASDSGKSDLALRLIDRGALLISDDYTQLTRDKDILIASAPKSIVGKMEIRGIGIINMPYQKQATVAMLVVLDRPPVRFPLEQEERILAGVSVREFALAAFEASAPIKVEMLVARL
jgi:serine kinase of HPr protein (carbohydrate metabolism regulator)